MKFQETLQEMEKIHTAKNKDYAGNDNPYKNFELIEYLTNGKVSVAEGILVRMTDKLSRIANLIKNPAQVKDEKITDTLIDLANYSIILKCYYDDFLSIHSASTNQRYTTDTSFIKKKVQ